MLLNYLKKENLILLKKALWNKNEKLRFFSPPNPEHVSHSIINYQNRYKENTNFIEVDAISIDKLLDKFNLNNQHKSFQWISKENKKDFNIHEYALNYLDF